MHAVPTTDPAPAAAVDPLDEYVRRIVDRAPPLTQEQRDRIAVLLRPPIPNGGRKAA